jgi:hypothetical protein
MYNQRYSWTRYHTRVIKGNCIQRDKEYRIDQATMSAQVMYKVKGTAEPDITPEWLKGTSKNWNPQETQSIKVNAADATRSYRYSCIWYHTMVIKRNCIHKDSAETIFFHILQEFESNQQTEQTSESAARVHLCTIAITLVNGDLHPQGQGRIDIKEFKSTRNTTKPWSQRSQCPRLWIPDILPWWSKGTSSTRPQQRFYKHLNPQTMQRQHCWISSTQTSDKIVVTWLLGAACPDAQDSFIKTLGK